MGLVTAPRVNQLLKSLYYSISNYSLSGFEQLNLGYVFHTERIFDNAIFSRLLRFCKSFKSLTGKKPICTLMPYTNARVYQESTAALVDEKNYLERTRQLAEVSDLGYHGHFWKDTSRLYDVTSEMKKENFSLLAFRSQFEKDIAWFKNNSISHNGAYAAGWWFMNREVLLSLLENNFDIDFSFSHSKWFQNPYAEKNMQENEIKTGELFRFKQGDHGILCVQNLIGCHQTPFPEDFVRNLLKLDFAPNTKVVTGVVNSHDYDLDEVNTLHCIEFLLKNQPVQFKGLDDFKRLTGSSYKCISLDKKND